MALGVNDNTIILANTVDLIVGGIYFFLLLSIIPPIIHKIFPKKTYSYIDNDKLLNELENKYIPGRSFFSINSLIQRLPLLLLSVLCTAVAVLTALLVTGSLDVLIIILLVTSLGIAFSFNKNIRNTPNSFSTGQYIIYMFSFAIGLSFSFDKINIDIVPILLFFAFVQYGSVILHLILSKINDIDGNISIITSTAGIYGPAL